jgi:hypothetical protein
VHVSLQRLESRLDGGYGVSPVVANRAANESEQYSAVFEQALSDQSVSVLPVAGVGFATIGVHSGVTERYRRLKPGGEDGAITGHVVVNGRRVTGFRNGSLDWRTEPD